MNTPRNIDINLLRTMPLPLIQGETDKNSRGKVLVVGGSRTVPGAVVLGGLAALRVGAGKIQLAVPACLAPAIGLVVLEAGILPLRESAEGEALPSEELPALAQHVDAVLVGPGMMNQRAARDVLRLLLQEVKGPVYVIDALALCDLWDEGPLLHSHGGRIVLTPHAGEMAQLCGMEKAAVAANPVAIARTAAERLGACIILKGATSFVVSPTGPAYVHTDGVVGLSTAGSGDVLAGIVAGLAGRGTDTITAAIWAVLLHGRAGRQLTQTVGKVGFIARELIEELPLLLEAVEVSTGSGSSDQAEGESPMPQTASILLPSGSKVNAP